MTSLTFELIRGDDRTLVIPALDAEGEPFDLTGASIRWQARARPEATETVFTKASGGQGVFVPEGDDTTARVAIYAADWSGWSGDEVLHWELEANKSGGVVTTVARGTITVRPDVVR
ncbi:MAG: hypothetical protein KF809_17410 [Chloroflexi bacterium]|nr:hypothetical protein [Chloroflexota bacterium]